MLMHWQLLLLLPLSTGAFQILLNEKHRRPFEYELACAKGRHTVIKAPEGLLADVTMPAGWLSLGDAYEELQPPGE